MANRASTTASWDPRTDRKAYIVWLTAIWLGMLVGFGLDFGRYLAEKPAPPLILHIHGAIYAVYLVLVTAQIALVEAGNIRLHRNLGWATAAVSAIMIPMGLAAAFIGEARVIGQPDADPQFLSLEFEEMIGFSVLTIAGLLLRRDPAAHKRLMILATIAISDAGFARAWIGGIKVTLPGPFGWWLQYFWGIALLLIAMAAWDLWRRKHIHPAVIGGAILLIGGEIIATGLFFSPGWKVMMAAAVKAWGYTG